jgi:nitrogen fixation/metabolism regulation signal transduction histidine kinase
LNLKLTFERRILVLAFLTGLPGSLVALLLLWFQDYTVQTRWTLTVFVLLFWFSFAWALFEKVRFPLQTLSNLLAAIREGDYSIRARGARHDDALGEVMLEVNTLGENLRKQRLGALEASALLAKVMSEIELAIFAFDNMGHLRLVNRAGERLMAQPAGRLLDRNAADLGLAQCLEGEATRTLQMTFPGGMGRWGVRRSAFREQGAPHQLLVLTDLSRTLREEERQAWQRLLRVLGHELNNSLAPIKSIAGSMESLLARDPKPFDWDQDMRRGLSVISGRAESLNRFMEAYARVARLPQPTLRPVDVRAWIQRVAGLETRLEVKVHTGPDLTLQADGDQLDQLLINLISNAVDAALETHGRVVVGWTRFGPHLEVWVEDEGMGVSNPANLFVPFFTTKSKGSGIGLVLSRQIAEAHGGGLTLENRIDRAGCVARLRLPLG